ncbi:MAG: esterase family protein [Clostridiales bacterium]|nr:esterase family protein [Clostridiales bacterium]
MRKRRLLLNVTALLCALAVPCSVYAEEAEEEQVQVEYSTADYDVDFKYTKTEIDHYKEDECDEQGTIVSLEYDAPAYLFNELLDVDETVHKKLNVYLPYNYDETQQYNVLYLMHGGGDNQEYWLGSDNGGRPVYGEITSNLLDNMIQEGLCDPVIVVAPTFYSPVDGMTIPDDVAAEYAEEVLGEPDIAAPDSLYTQFFQYELRNDIIPLIESTYSTYAGGDTSEENLIATRDHRAYAGLSMGSMTSVHSVLEGCSDIISYVGSYSGIKANFDNFKSIMEEDFADYEMNYWYNGEGVEDIAFEEHIEFHNNVTSQMTDKFVDGENYAMVVLEDGNHAWTSWITHLYNTLLVFFK